MPEGLVEASIDARGVARVAIDNELRLNCLSGATAQAFADAVNAYSGRNDLRAVVVTGNGPKAFMGGADLRELGGLDPVSGRAFISRIHAMSKALRDCPVPVIGRINGYCLGAGLEVAAACDMRVASDNAVLGMPEVRVGLPSVVEAALFPQLIGWGRAKLLCYTGENIDAAEALSWGLVEKVVPAGELDNAVEHWVEQILEGGPRAIRLQKELIREWEAMPVNDAIQAGIRSLVRAMETDEPKRMIAEVLERLAKRKG